MSRFELSYHIGAFPRGEFTIVFHADGEVPNLDDLGLIEKVRSTAGEAYGLGYSDCESVLEVWRAVDRWLRALPVVAEVPSLNGREVLVVSVILTDTSGKLIEYRST